MHACAMRRAPSPHSAILSCDQLRASPTPQVSRGRRAASETSRPSSAHDGAAFFGSLPRKHTSNPSQRSLRTPRTPPRPPKHPICHIAILSVSMTKASSPPVALSKHIKTTTNLNCAAPPRRNRVLPRAVRPQSAPAASRNQNRAFGAARARARRLKNGMAGRQRSQRARGAFLKTPAHPRVTGTPTRAHDDTHCTILQHNAPSRGRRPRDTITRETPRHHIIIATDRRPTQRDHGQGRRDEHGQGRRVWWV